MPAHRPRDGDRHSPAAAAGSTHPHGAQRHPHADRRVVVRRPDDGPRTTERIHAHLARAANELSELADSAATRQLAVELPDALVEIVTVITVRQDIRQGQFLEDALRALPDDPAQLHRAAQQFLPWLRLPARRVTWRVSPAARRHLAHARADLAAAETPATVRLAVTAALGTHLRTLGVDI